MSRVDRPAALNGVETAAAWAARLADGELTAAQEREFEAWLSEDGANGEALEEIVGAWDAVEHYAATEPMMALREAALALGPAHRAGAQASASVETVVGRGLRDSLAAHGVRGRNLGVDATLGLRHARG